MLSIGLLDKPEETKYYDYLLTDPKDAPFASFRFHYRSRRNLRELQLIPPEHSLPSPSISSGRVGLTRSDTKRGFPFQEADSKRFSFDFESLNDTGLDYSQPSTAALNTESRHCRLSDGWGSPHKSPALTPASARTGRVPEPSKAVRDGFPQSYLQRPLPELPRPGILKREASARRTGHARNHSTASTVSITPSLWPYAEDPSTGNDTVELGIAKQVEVRRLHTPPRKSVVGNKRRIESPDSTTMTNYLADSSVSEYDVSHLPSEDSRESLLPSPGNYMATTGSLLERHLSNDSSSPRCQDDLDGAELRTEAGEVPGGDAENDFNRRSREYLVMSESEWIRTTPSPVQSKAHHQWTPRMWSPLPNRRKPIPPTARRA